MKYNVYLISVEIGTEKHYKIGYTKRRVIERVREFKTGNASEFQIVDSFASEWGTKIESMLHRQFKSKKISGEWFLLNDSDVKNFNSICQKYHENLSLMKNSNTYVINRGGRL